MGSMMGGGDGPDFGSMMGGSGGIRRKMAARAVRFKRNSVVWKLEG